MIDLKKLEKLISLMVDNDLTEMDLEDGTEKVALKRGGPAARGALARHRRKPPPCLTATPKPSCAPR